MIFSVIIAVYQREDELSELLTSLSDQTDKHFEVLVIDDGSPAPLENIVEEFKSALNIHYFYKPNSGPAKSRNFGMERASGNYFIFLDSDTLVPERYIEIVRKALNENYTDIFGGPDGADESFTDLQKAISFSMTSFLTTGGIRGGGQQLGRFQPRSFNMGISKKAFSTTGGFGDLRIGEDPDLTMTLWEHGFNSQLILEAKVVHKRRTSLKKFQKQVFEFGVARPILNLRHPTYKKITFWFPTVFMLGFFFSILLLLYYLFGFGEIFMLFPIFFYLTYFFLHLIFAFLEMQSFRVALLSLKTTFIQFSSYGYGFLLAWIQISFLKNNPKKIFPNHFSK